ncbi:MAG TPA: type VI secretion system protein TssA, partial [Stellaceae bacterium]|nr:type VI secretion system protein TssA [Stellaceae bacterium]
MSGGQVLDIDALLAAISEAAPTGTDLREDSSPQSIYYRLKDARSAARAAERRSDTEGETSTALLPEWRTVLDLSREALAQKSKDLEVACWLVEAAVRAHGFAGLHDAMTVVQRLTETYWDALHSLKDEDGMATFVAPLSGLNGVEGEGTLIQPIRKVPVTSGDAGPYAAYHYDQAVALGQVVDAAAKERRMATGVPTVEQFEQALRASPKDFLRAEMKNLTGSLAALEALSSFLSEKCGHDAPPTSTIRETIDTVYALIRSRTLDLIPPEVAPEAEAGAGEATANGAANGATVNKPLGQINDREDALRILAKVS